MAAKQEFASRFARHKDELEWLFMELYHNREGLEVLEREMAEAYNARSAELKALDKARSADPEWYKRGNMFGMTMYTDLFAGNLKELARKLPYLKEQKLTYLHLMPLLQMPHPHNDGGYAVEDFDTVDPALGTNKDLENLTRELRKAGISLCLDFVMNHTASTHRWAMAAKAGDPWFQAYYHLYDDRTIPDQYERLSYKGIFVGFGQNRFARKYSERNSRRLRIPYGTVFKSVVIRPYGDNVFAFYAKFAYIDALVYLIKGIIGILTVSREFAVNI